METQVIAITATFTAEPLADALVFWLDELGISADIIFAPYNQVFQELLNPASLLGRNQRGINVILVRSEDWQGTANVSLDEATIRRAANELVEAVRAAADRSAIPHIVCLCPGSPGCRQSRSQAVVLDGIEQWIADQLRVQAGVSVITSAQAGQLYPVATEYDPHGDELGHIPYTAEYFAAVATLLARKIHALRTAPFKVIAVDCDETLWKGVCGEVGPQGVELDPPRRLLQEFLVAQHDAGMLLCLCSKNSAGDVHEVFACHPEMPLRPHHFVAQRINWLPKSANLQSLATELRVGLDSFIFVDDNPLECAEVEAHCPSVLTLELPREADRIGHFLAHTWAFDRHAITAEDRQRTKLYKQNRARQQLREESLTLADFLAQLELKVQIAGVLPEQLARVAQLTQRTNQFNVTTIRRTEAEIMRLCQAGERECLVVQVSDRFGDYGLVGVILFRRTETALVVDTLLLSCRVLGRGVEHQILSRLGLLAQEAGLAWVLVPFVPTSKNQPARDFLEAAGAPFPHKQGNQVLYRFPARRAARMIYHPVETQTEVVGTGDAHSTFVVAGPGAGRAPARLLRRIVDELSDPEQVVQAVAGYRRRQNTLAASKESASRPPQGPLEEAIAAIWTLVLGVSALGTADDFFDLGGDSLRGTQVVARLRQTFAVSLSLDTLFQAPTVEALARRIQDCAVPEESFGSTGEVVAITPRGDKGPCALSFGQQRLWFLEQLTPGTATYNVSFALRIRWQLRIDALHQALDGLVARHEALRTSFGCVDGNPVQIVAHDWPSVVRVLDLSGEPERAKLLVTEEAARPFDLSCDLMLRATLLRLDADDFILLLVTHHIAWDLHSQHLMFRELAELYEAAVQGRTPALAPLAIQYADFAVWQRRHLQGEHLELLTAYWRRQLAGAPPKLELPTDFPRPAVQSLRGSKYFFRFPEALFKQAAALGRTQRATLYGTLLAAFKVFLLGWTGEEDLCVGSPIAGRDRIETEGLIGFFANTLVLRTRLKSELTFREILARVRETALGAQTHQELPFEKLVEILRPPRDLSRNPLFQVNFRVAQVPAVPPALAGLPIETLETIDNLTSKFDLALELGAPSGSSSYWEYSADLFAEATVRRLAGAFENLVADLLAQPDLPVCELAAFAHLMTQPETAGGAQRGDRSFRAVRRRVIDLAPLGDEAGVRATRKGLGGSPG
jgi:FkbH-like protein